MVCPRKRRACAIYSSVIPAKAGIKRIIVDGLWLMVTTSSRRRAGAMYGRSKSSCPLVSRFRGNDEESLTSACLRYSTTVLS